MKNSHEQKTLVKEDCHWDRSQGFLAKPTLFQLTFVAPRPPSFVIGCFGKSLQKSTALNGDFQDIIQYVQGILQ